MMFGPFFRRFIRFLQGSISYGVKYLKIIVKDALAMKKEKAINFEP